MRITIWLSLAVFVTTLYWPHLLSVGGILGCALSIFIFIFRPKWRIFAILPLTAVYFSLFVQINLFGFSPEMTNILPIIKENITSSAHSKQASPNKQHVSLLLINLASKTIP